MAYQRILQLTYIDDLLAAMKRLFVQYFAPILTAFVASLHTINAAKSAVLQTTQWDFKKAFMSWDVLFDKLLKGLEEKAASVCLVIFLSFLSKGLSGSTVSHASCYSATP